MNREKTQVKGVALVTGAARRIGATIAEALHQHGYDVVIHCYQSVHEAKALMKALNEQRENSACICIANLCIRSETTALIEQAFQWKCRLDVLVNNASQFIKTPLREVDDSIWDTLWRVHVKAPFELSQSAYPLLSQSENGNIVNITDIYAEKPRREYAVYTQTKAALKMQTEALALEYAPDVRVNAVAPGPILLPEGGNALSIDAQRDMISRIPLLCWGSPVWVADAVLSVVSNLYMTGETMRVDGGKRLTV